MSFGSPKPQTSTTVTEPWAEQKPYLENIFKEADRLYNEHTPEYYPGATNATRDPLTLWGQQGQMALMPQIYGQLTGASQGLGDILGGKYAPGQYGASTPGFKGLSGYGGETLDRLATGEVNTQYLDPVVQAAIRRNTEGSEDQFRLMGQNYSQNVIPGIGAEAVVAGGTGSSRHGIAEGLASQSFNERMAQQVDRANKSNADISSRLYSDAFQQAQNLSGQAAGQLGQLDLGQMNARENARGTDINAGLRTNELNEQGRSNNVMEMLKGAALQPGLSEALSGIFDPAIDIGRESQFENQNVINDLINKWNFDQNLPWAQLGNLNQMIKGDFGGTSESMAKAGGGGTAQTLGTILSLASIFAS